MLYAQIGMLQLSCHADQTQSPYRMQHAAIQQSQRRIMQCAARATMQCGTLHVTCDTRCNKTPCMRRSMRRTRPCQSRACEPPNLSGSPGGVPSVPHVHMPCEPWQSSLAGFRRAGTDSGLKGVPVRKAVDSGLLWQGLVTPEGGWVVGCLCGWVGAHSDAVQMKFGERGSADVLCDRAAAFVAHTVRS